MLGGFFALEQCEEPTMKVAPDTNEGYKDEKDYFSFDGSQPAFLRAYFMQQR